MITALIPARSGSKRVPNKNIREFHGYPLIAYSIAYALSSPLVSEVIVSSDSVDICDLSLKFGASGSVLRPKEISSEFSPDIDWIKHLDSWRPMANAYAAIVRPTSPLRSSSLFSDMWSYFRNQRCDSIRTIKLVKEHPGKMWKLSEGGFVTPYESSRPGMPAPHSLQYASLPTVYVQTSALEIFDVNSMRENGTREGNKICGFITAGLDSWAIDEPEDWDLHKVALENNPSLKSRLHSMINRFTT